MTITVTSARFSNAEGTAAEIVTLEHGAMLVSEASQPEIWAAMLAAVSPDPYSDPAAVPASVSQRQARRALLDAELLDEVEAAVAAAPKAVQVDWEFSDVIKRDNAAIAAMSAELGLTSEQVDALFVAAAAIVD